MPVVYKVDSTVWHERQMHVQHLPQLHFTPPPIPPRPCIIALGEEHEPPRFWKSGPYSRSEAKAALLKFRDRAIPPWARPKVLGQLFIRDHVMLYVENPKHHITVWLALDDLGATQTTQMPDAGIWLVGTALLKWSEGRRGEPIRRPRLTGTKAASGAEDIQLKTLESNDGRT
jgi:hypothetical protein